MTSIAEITNFSDDAQTVERLNAVACLMQWMHSAPAPLRKRFWGMITECGDAAQEAVVRLLGVLKDPHATPFERQRALTTMSDALFPNPSEDGDRGIDLTSEAAAAERYPPVAREVDKMNSQEGAFASRLRELMESKSVSQRELANRAGCSQPAISQMLNRNCRPRKKTIVKLAEALNVRPRDLWPDMETVKMLDAVVSFQQDDYVMTDAEAAALSSTAQRNPPKIRAKSLPSAERRR